VEVELHRVTSAQEMLDTCLRLLPHVDGVIAVAAVADYRPGSRFSGKMRRTGDPLHLELVPNPDILAEIGRRKAHRWTVGFAVESDDGLARAREKLRVKNCDAIVLNLRDAMESAETSIQLLDRSGAVALQFSGPKELAAERIAAWIEKHLAEIRPVA
jgi:phosphopantothenoylcysteine decarboxylase/phosphopantothenate--cysteine ligase